MQRHHLTIDGQKFYLPADADVDDLGERLVQASRNHGDVVMVDVIGGRTLRIVASPGPPIVIESEEVPPADTDSETGDPSAFTTQYPDDL